MHFSVKFPINAFLCRKHRFIDTTKKELQNSGEQSVFEFSEFGFWLLKVTLC